MKYYDRLYGELEFPKIISELLDCPGLLRLRDVRMANNQFVAFPAFANSSRYEHSLGVCYLAKICAESLELSEKDTIELMIACLYHDVGTPPFAHAMEEVLQANFNFDHEENLRQIIYGTNGSVEGNLEQIYLGTTTKLRSVCHSALGRKAGLDLHSVYRIADIIVGAENDPLSPLLNGGGMDLDNIDNVIRASSAMGIIDVNETNLAVRLAKAFVFDNNGKICYDGMHLKDIRRWQQIRDEQYTAIFDSVDDFAYQTMIKKAISLLLEENNSEYSLTKDSWKLTDSSILHKYLLGSSKSRHIIERVQLCKPFSCLGILYVKGEKAIKYINSHVNDIEIVASGYFQDVLGLDENDDKIKKLNTNAVVANFYPDKRKRHIHTEAMYMGETTLIDTPSDNKDEGALLGLFTPLYNANYKLLTNLDGRTTRKVVSFRQKNLDDLIKVLKSEILSGFEVSVYGKESNGRNNKKTEEYQLGFSGL